MKKMTLLFFLWIFLTPLWGQQIIRAEYFIGEDPGFGKGTPVAVTAGSEAEMSFNIPLGSLGFGLNTLYSRVKDSDGTWSQTFHHVFLKQGLPLDANLSITKMEYFIDEDPGIGKASPIALKAGVEIAVVFNIPLDKLTSGIHTLYVRTKDNKGCWSMISNQAFLVQMMMQDTQQLTYLEYFIDKDPGFGKATSIGVQAGAKIVVAFNIPLDKLNSGIHTLYVRTKDNKGSWSMISNQAFLVQMMMQNTLQVSCLEYFFDKDPGFGKAKPIEFQAGAEISVAVNLPLETLSDGIHTLYVRTCDDNGSWGMVFNQVFMKNFTLINNAMVTRMEYFVNTDPGVGHGTMIEMNTPKQTVMKYFVINPGNFQDGTNTLYVRTLDNQGKWGLVYFTDFEVRQTEPCNPPSDLSATDVTETSAGLGWTETGQGTSWDLLWVPDGYDYTEDADLSTGISKNPHQIDTLSKATVYDFYVRTLCSDGQVSAWAGPGIFHTLPLNMNQVTLFSDPPEGGTVTGEGTFSSGETVSISAIANTNYVFQYWTGDTSLLDDVEAGSTTFTMPSEPVTLTAQFKNSIGIPEITGSSFKIFPNPARNELWIEFYNPDKCQLNIQLINIHGQLVAQKNIKATDMVQTSLNTSRLSPGFYQLAIHSEQWNLTRKVIIKQ